jgi:ADP-ribosylglycohydrolase
MRGGDTDTNGAIAGALLGTVYGHEAVPSRLGPLRALMPARFGITDLAHFVQ